MLSLLLLLLFVCVCYVVSLRTDVILDRNNNKNNNSIVIEEEEEEDIVEYIVQHRFYDGELQYKVQNEHQFLYFEV